MKSPLPDETSVLVFSWVELLGCLAVLVPPPRLHAVQYLSRVPRLPSPILCLEPPFDPLAIQRFIPFFCISSAETTSERSCCYSTWDKDLRAWCLAWTRW